MDEEAQKRNTDCVYFLASPLTCKKGNNCEFRHSEAARMNPRDCWYWIHGTCRNPNCSFRHPPLEGKPLSSVQSQSGAAASLASTTAVPTGALASKSKTPCYFFSQGNCAKGDKCPYMHGPAPVTVSADAATQQKPLKAHQSETGQASNKPVVMPKSSAANVSKPSPPENVEERPPTRNNPQLVNLKASAVSAREKPQVSKDSEKAKVLGSVAASNPYRNENVPGDRKSRITLFSDTPDEFLNSTDRLQNAHVPVEERQGQSGRKQQQQSHHEHEQWHSLQVADHRHQNGSKADEWWKNGSSSLDGEASDQSLQREDCEYSSSLRSRGRAKGLDDLASRTFKGSQRHGRDGFGSAPPQHRQAHHTQHREQQMQHESDYNGITDHLKHHGISSTSRTSSRDGQKLAVEGYTSTVDLRDHLMKRRRDDRGNHLRTDILLRRPQSEMVEASHINQRRDDGFAQKDHQSRVSSRGVDHRGIKRLRHDGGASSPDGRPSRISPIRRLGPGRSPDRGLSGVSPSIHPVLDYSRSEARERGRDRYVSKIASASDVKRQSVSSKSVKSEYAKEDTGFTGPKSLAQIKAEREAESNARAEGHSQRGKQSEDRLKLANLRSLTPANHQDTLASTSGPKKLQIDNLSVSKRESKLASSEDFEGPKPLSFLLKQKQKVESGGNVEVNMAVSKKAEDVISDSNREMEDGEVRDEEDEWKNDQSHYADSPIAPPQKEIVPGSESDVNAEEALEADHSQGMVDAHDGMGSSDDELRLDIGQTLSEDEDYELDDDDDDDFAKKLGGMFS